MQESWIAEFKQTNGRSPKILHIGNIANNAYQNAKMLINAGADCDVICSDYYHEMASPEWDDADYDEDIGNAFFPKWHKVNLKGFSRPKWFIQAPMQICNQYLLAKCKNNHIKAFYYWNLAKKVRVMQSENKPVNLRLHNFFTNICFHTKNTIDKFIKILFLLLTPTKIIPAIKKRTDKEVQKKIKEELEKIKEEQLKKFDLEKKEKISFFQNQLESLYPEYNKKLGEETYSYIYVANTLKELFGYYDIIIGYATDCVYPFLCGYKNFIAYEHGTIRDYPYQDSDLSRLTLLAYGNSKAIYSTNTDCFESAQFIAKPKTVPVVCGLHGIDIDKSIENSKIYTRSLIDGRFGVSLNKTLFFCPARHSIDAHYNKFIKGNDKIVQAFSKLSENEDFAVVFLNWGSHVEEIKQMISEYPKLQEKVIWINPLKKADLRKVYSCVDAVVDQFFLNVFGGIMLESLVAEKSVVISASVSESLQIKYFDSIVPYLPCDSVNEIFEKMKCVINEKSYIREIAQKGMEWVEKYHSNKKIVQKLEKTFFYCTEL